MLKLGVVGCGGRMGRRVVALACASEDFELLAALEKPDHPLLGSDAGTVAGVGDIGITISQKPAAQLDAIIDFSTPEATKVWADYSAANELPLVIGTTGLSDRLMEKLRQVATHAAVLVSANMSLGVNLLFKLAGQVAQILDESYDVEIVETHHRFKRDAPSGTALELAHRVASAKNWPWPDCLVHGRHGKDALRQSKTVGIHAIRAGDTVGEHDLIFAALGETVRLSHTAHTRDTFARGALHAAQWLSKQKHGLYSMADVLGL